MRSVFFYFAKFFMAVAAAAILTACGGGDEPMALSAEKMSAAMPRQAVAGSVTSNEAAELLMNAGGVGYAISLLSFVFVIFVGALALLVGAIQAYVFALLTSLYINDAVNLH